MLGTLNVHINAMGLVDTEAAASLLLLLTLKQNGVDVEVEARPCALQVPDIPLAGQPKPIHFELGPALVASIPPVTGKGKLDGATTCATLECEPITLLIGARMNPPAAGLLPEADSSGRFSACLPTSADCAGAITQMCACDQELDGFPGATLRVSNVPAVALDEVYVDLRTTFSLSGQVWSSDLVVGELTASLEQGILGCSKVGGGSCSTGEVNTVRSLNPKITQSVDEVSVFRSVRVDSATTCAQLIVRKDELFGR